MPTIDADAHVSETERTWEYLVGAEKEFRPKIVSTRGPEGKEEVYWLIDGRLQPKSQNVGQDAPTASREMADIEARLKHMDELEVGVQVLYPSLFLRPITNRPEFERLGLWTCGYSKRDRGLAPFEAKRGDEAGSDQKDTRR